MVLCGVCNVWQHAICFGLLQEEDVPEFHVCEQCAQSADDKSQGSTCSQSGAGGGHKCTDPFLQFLSPVALQVHVRVCKMCTYIVLPSIHFKHLNLRAFSEQFPLILQ